MFRKKQILLFLCCILLIGIVTPLTTTTAASSTVKISSDQLNIRKGPGLSYPIVGKAKRGESYPLRSEKEDWIEIKLPNGSTGWVANWLVSKVNSSQNNPSTVNNKGNEIAIISTDGLRVRKGPDTSYQVIGTVQKGDTFAIQNRKSNWIQLKTPFGDGWVSSDFVKIQNDKVNHSSSVGFNGRITADSLNVRSSPSLNSQIIGKLYSGDTVKILSQNSEWTEIFFSGKKAWISSQYVEAVNDSKSGSSDQKKPNKSSTSNKNGKVTATTLTVRDTGSLNGNVVSTVSKGQSFEILEELNNWAKIEYKNGSFGWVASWYLDISEDKHSVSSEKKIKDSSVQIIHDGTNIRKSPNTNSQVVQRANQGETFDIISIQDDWYEIRLTNGDSGFIAGWIVSVNGSAPIVEKPGSEQHLQNKKIVIDPGHGGRDNGTTGANGTIEKTLTLKTAQLLYDKLKSAGANVILTRNTDTYIPLSSRVYASHYHNADAFISIHYDSLMDRSVNGMTTYYYHSYQKNLAENVHSSITSNTNLKDRSYRFGDYYVLRENKRNAILLELGYLSNPGEEIVISSPQFQDSVTSGIYQGIARYFKENN
ncbi:SH3 domain-containing protein [Cytobacillus dafuensis]|uniref:SH3 domain-containing protein n=1 Tax=Cytobacillus dafuensis TaxID=1742359 RepID=A0A5B8Z6I9_CYTDA|nr:SH3 domain-containing protein [Cytobacillus dafuensis]QED48752.1 SH3 domain-containing protein [Cytobacillus dafuensis]